MQSKIKNKTIIYVINDFNVGGAAKIMNWLSQESLNIFSKVYIISIYNLKEETKNKINEKIEIFDLNLKDNEKSGILGRIRQIKKLKKEINKIDPDLICSFVSDVNVNTYFATRKSKAKIILAERGDPFTLNKIWKRITNLDYKIVAHFLFQTNTAKKFYNLDDKKASVIPNPYSSEFKNTYDGHKENIIYSAGRLVREKGFDILINSFAEVYESYPNYELIIYGEGSERNNLELLIGKLDLSNNIKLPGYIDNIQKHIQNGTMFVLPSRYEGMPNVLIEAMMTGIPTISMDCTPGGPRFLTDNGKRGVLVELGNQNQLTKSIINLIENDEIRSVYSKKGLELIEELNPDNILKLWIEMFEKVIN